MKIIIKTVLYNTQYHCVSNSFLLFCHAQISTHDRDLHRLLQK